MIDELPELREVDALISDARDLAQRCALDQPADQVAAMLESGLSIMLELRVPRMPEDPADLAFMLDAAMDGPTYSTEQVMEHLRTSGDAFSMYLDRFRRDVACESWTSAATMLLPSKSPGAPAWGGGPIVNRIALTESGGGTVTLKRGDDSVECSSPIGGLAILGAVMLAHAEWEVIWRR